MLIFVNDSDSKKAASLLIQNGINVKAPKTVQESYMEYMARNALKRYYDKEERHIVNVNVEWECFVEEHLNSVKEILMKRNSRIYEEILSIVEEDIFNYVNNNIQDYLDEEEEWIY